MCVVSMVMDHYSHKPFPGFWTQPSYEEYKELLRKARLYDEMTKQPDCEKPELKEFDRRLDELMRIKIQNKNGLDSSPA